MTTERKPLPEAAADGAHPAEMTEESLDQVAGGWGFTKYCDANDGPRRNAPGPEQAISITAPHHDGIR